MYIIPKPTNYDDHKQHWYLGFPISNIGKRQSCNSIDNIISIIHKGV